MPLLWSPVQDTDITGGGQPSRQPSMRGYSILLENGAATTLRLHSEFQPLVWLREGRKSRMVLSVLILITMFNDS
jgi:hypothetical protein